MRSGLSIRSQELLKQKAEKFLWAAFRSTEGYSLKVHLAFEFVNWNLRCGNACALPELYSKRWPHANPTGAGDILPPCPV